MVNEFSMLNAVILFTEDDDAAEFALGCHFAEMWSGRIDGANELKQREIQQKMEDDLFNSMRE